MKRKPKRMKAWRGWVLVCIKTGLPWYGNAVMDKRKDAVEQHWTADDGLGKSTRIARVRVSEVQPRRGKGARR